MRCVSSAICPPHPTNFEQVTKVSFEEIIETQFAMHRSEVSDAKSFVADCLPKEFRALHEDVFTGQLFIAKMEVRICQIDGKHRLVIMRCRTEEHKRLPLQA
jgi:hypothetical protein